MGGGNHGLDGKDEEAVEWLSNKIYQINIEMGPYAASLVNNFRIGVLYCKGEMKHNRMTI